MSSFQVLRNPVPNQRVKWVDEKGFLTPEALKTQAAQDQASTLRTPTLISSSHATRSSIPASQYADGSIFHETDRNLFYVAITGSWIYLSGTYQITQSSVDGLAAGLSANDVGLLLYIADYNHLLIWNGNSFTWAPAENGSGMIEDFSSSPASPGTGWKLCDGSTNVLTLQPDGSLVFATVPTSAGHYFRQ